MFSWVFWNVTLAALRQKKSFCKTETSFYTRKHWSCFFHPQEDIFNSAANGPHSIRKLKEGEEKGSLEGLPSCPKMLSRSSSRLSGEGKSFHQLIWAWASCSIRMNLTDQVHWRMTVKSKVNMFIPLVSMKGSPTGSEPSPGFTEGIGSRQGSVHKYESYQVEGTLRWFLE